MTTQWAPSIALLEQHPEPAGALRAATVVATGDGLWQGHEPGPARAGDRPVDMPADGGPGARANPEQLFGAAYASCFHGALMLLATHNGVKAAGASVSVTVSLAGDPVDGLFLLSAEVRVSLPGVPKAVAEGLVRNAERVSPYAKMARHGIDSMVTLVSPPV